MLSSEVKQVARRRSEAASPTASRRAKPVLFDVIDRASPEADRALELRARERQRKLISKIDAALVRLDEGTYGYCEETGEPIALRRLEARPIATLSMEAHRATSGIVADLKALVAVSCTRSRRVKNVTDLRARQYRGPPDVPGGRPRRVIGFTA